jgi:hypothetical protein
VLWGRGTVFDRFYGPFYTCTVPETSAHERLQRLVMRSLRWSWVSPFRFGRRGLQGERWSSYPSSFQSLLLVDGLVLADRWSLAAGDGWGFSGLLRLKLIKSAWTKFCFCLSVHAPIIVNFSFSWPFNVSGRMMGASYTLFILTTPFKSI